QPGTTNVATFPANPWGLHDMHGNVWEWCADHWHETYDGAPQDGLAWVNQDPDGKQNEDDPRLLRGGSWDGDPGDCRSGCRLGGRPDYRLDYIGFRVCCLPQD
ncbi:MAG: formylglycine-generating enzyme family protein, partial [Cyanobacteriota bacterium]